MCLFVLLTFFHIAYELIPRLSWLEHIIILALSFLWFIWNGPSSQWEWLGP